MDGAALQHHAHKLRIELRNMAPIYRAPDDDAPPAYTPRSATDDTRVDGGGRQHDQEYEGRHGDGSDVEYCSEAEQEDDSEEYEEDEDEDEEHYGIEYDNEEEDGASLCHPGNKHTTHSNPYHAARTMKSAVPPHRDQHGWNGEAVAKAVRAIQQQRAADGNHTISLPGVPHTAPATIAISARTTIHGNNNTLTPGFALIGARLAHALVTRLEDTMPASPLAAASAPSIPGLRRGSLRVDVDCGINIVGNGNVVGTSSTPSPFLIRNSIPADHPAALAAPAPASTNTTHSATMPSGFTVPGNTAKLPSAELCLNASESESMPRSCQPACPELSTEAGTFGDVHGTARHKRAREKSDCGEHGSDDGDGADDEKARRCRRCRGSGKGWSDMEY